MRSEDAAAIALDPLLAEAHAAAGWVYAFEFDWKNAGKSFERAIELDPDLTQTRTSYAIAALEPLGEFDEALRVLREAKQRDPSSLDVRREIGQAQMFAGRYEEALDTFRGVRAVDPNFAFVDVLLARTLVYAGRPLEELLTEYAPYERLAIVHAGVQKEAEEMLQHIKEYLPHGDIPIVQITPVLGAHLGVGALGFACISTKEQP